MTAAPTLSYLENRKAVHVVRAGKKRKTITMDSTVGLTLQMRRGESDSHCTASPQDELCDSGDRFEAESEAYDV